jgi:hypothetical protein
MYALPKNSNSLHLFMAIVILLTVYPMSCSHSIKVDTGGSGEGIDYEAFPQRMEVEFVSVYQN